MAENVHMFKIILLGDSGVGKSSISSRFTNPSSIFTPTAPTIGLDFNMRIITLSNGERISSQIFDLSGHEKYQDYIVGFMRSANGVVFMYDVTDESSFQNIRAWISTLDSNSLARMPAKILVGNKCDCAERMISFEDGEKLATELGMKFLEASAKENINIDELFHDLVADILLGIEKS